MSTALTSAQRQSLEATLRQRLNELDRRTAQHSGGTSRVEHAREVLLQDGDEAAHHEGEREVELATADRDVAELGAVSLALRRLADGEYGQCTDCGTGIPFARLQVEPEAARCVACESRHEQLKGRSGR